MHMGPIGWKRVGAHLVVRSCGNLNAVHARHILWERDAYVELVEVIGAAEVEGGQAGGGAP